MRHCPDFCYNARLGADVAQLVEQRIRNAKVASSIPAIGTISNLLIRKDFIFPAQWVGRR